MRDDQQDPGLVAVADVREFFRESLQTALEHQHLHIRDHTEHYAVNLLAMFARTDALFEPGPEQRTQLEPLALLLAEAVDAPDQRQRFRILQRLGDVALFVAGFLAGSFARRPVDIDCQWNLEKDGYIFTASRFVRHKGLHYLIEAYKNLEDRGKTGEKKLVITGEGFHTDDYVRYLKKISQERNSIVFTGPQSGKELDQLFYNAFLFVQPSESEGLSLALLEAMGYGKAVLISNIPENRESAKEAGLVFASTDIHDLENKLAELIGNPKLAQHLGQKAKARIAKFYNWQSIADKIEKIYQEILRQKKYGKNVDLDAPTLHGHARARVGPGAGPED